MNYRKAASLTGIIVVVFLVAACGDSAPTSTLAPTIAVDTPAPTDAPAPTPTSAPIAETPTPTVTLTPTSEETTPTPPPNPAQLYFSLKDDRTLGDLNVANEDVVAFDGASFSIFFDGSDVGLNPFAVDGFAIAGENLFLFSFTDDITIPGIDGITDDSDIVQFTATSMGDVTAGTFSLYFDGSDVDLNQDGEDLDAIELLPDGRILLSTTNGLRVAEQSGADEDVFAFTPTSLGEDTAGSWEMYLDASDIGLGSVTEEINGFAVDASGDLYMSASGRFSVDPISGTHEDVLQCQDPTIGGKAACGSFALFFDGGEHGLDDDDLSAVELP